MKPWFFGFLVLVMAQPLVSQSVTLINTLPQRPVFTLLSQGVNESRTVAPGERVALQPGLFSGLGDKRTPLIAGTTYYLARLGASPRLYRLPPNQALVLNQAGRPVAVVLAGERSAQGVLADGALALGALNAEHSLTLAWDDGQIHQVSLQGGRVYRLVLGPEGGSTVSVVAWD